MGEIIRILMERDGLTREEALQEARVGMAEVESAIMDGDYMCAEDAFEDFFGLEPDCLMDALC